MRLYTFCNFYLSSIAQGIQSAHVVHELFLKYPKPDGPVYMKVDNVLWDWARSHKTMIVLNGGINADLAVVRDFLTYNASQIGVTIGYPQGLPWASFNEDGASLGGIMTCVGVVVPEIFYDASHQGDVGNWEYDCGGTTKIHREESNIRFIELLKSKSLAR